MAETLVLADGLALEYYWDLGGGILREGPTVPNPFPPDATGRRRAVLTVHDDLGGTDSATVIVDFGTPSAGRRLGQSSTRKGKRQRGGKRQCFRLHGRFHPCSSLNRANPEEFCFVQSLLRRVPASIR